MEKEKKKKSKSAKSVSSKKKLGAAAGFNAPSYGAEIDVLTEFMNKNFYKTLKTCLDLLSGDGSLEVSDTLVLTANYLKGDAGAKVEVQERLTAREELEAPPAPEGSGHVSKPVKKKPDPIARMEFDQWVLPSYESAMLKMMQGRLVGGGELGGPAERLARLLVDEAKAFQSAQPRGAIVPSIPEVDNTSIYEFAHTVSEAPMVVSDKVNTGSLLMLLEQQLQDDDLPGSVAKLDEMLSQELANQKEACDEAAQLLINTIKRHRGLKALIDAGDREAVASSLDAARAVITTAAQDIVGGCLEGAMSKIEVLLSSEELNKALNESAGAEGAKGAGGAAPSPEELAKSQIAALISKVKKESEEAVVAMEGAVEAQLYDHGADLIARIFIEERAVVQVLPIRPWQVKVKRTHAAVMGAIERVVTKLTAPVVEADGPPPKTEKGKAAAERPMPFFEVMTLLISSICRCLGDAERALGIGMDPDPSWDMEFLNWAPQQEESESAEFDTYVNAMRNTRNEAEYSLKMAIRNVVEAAGWTAGVSVASPEKSVIPGKLLMRQLEMSGALQRLQSRLMCCLKALQPPTAILWNPDTLKVIQESPTGDTPPASPGSSAAVQEAAAMVPVLRAFKGLHEELTDAWPTGEKKISQWLAQALINIAELERHCTHISMEVKGFAERVQPGRSGILDKEGESPGGEKDAEAAEQPGPEDGDANAAEETKQPAEEAQETKEEGAGAGDDAAEEAAAELEAAALKELEADLDKDPEQSQPTDEAEVEAKPQENAADEGDSALQEVADILKMVASFMQSLRQSVSQNLQ